MIDKSIKQFSNLEYLNGNFQQIFLLNCKFLVYIVETYSYYKGDINKMFNINLKIYIIKFLKYILINGKDIK